MGSGSPWIDVRESKHKIDRPSLFIGRGDLSKLPLCPYLSSCGRVQSCDAAQSLQRSCFASTISRASKQQVYLVIRRPAATGTCACVEQVSITA